LGASKFLSCVEIIPERKEYFILCGASHHLKPFCHITYSKTHLPFKAVIPKLCVAKYSSSKTGVANPRPAGRMRPKKEFLRPKLGLKLGDFSIFWVFFHSFYQNLAQKINIFGN
jgi:hypothetical protein